MPIHSRTEPVVGIGTAPIWLAIDDPHRREVEAAAGEVVISLGEPAFGQLRMEREIERDREIVELALQIVAGDPHVAGRDVVERRRGQVTADLAGAVIEVIICREFVMGGLLGDRDRTSSHGPECSRI